MVVPAVICSITLNKTDLLPTFPRAFQYMPFSVFKLGSVDEFEPVSCGGNMNHADETLGELVVSGGNGAVDFQSAKHPFD